MKQKSLTGKIKEVPTTPYLVDWDGEQGSQFSANVLDFLYPYWKNDVVLAEWPVVATRLRYDFVNLSRKIVVETDGRFHNTYSPHFHSNRLGYLNQIKRDLTKDKIAELNGFKMIRITPNDLPLSPAWFKKTYDITL